MCAMEFRTELPYDASPDEVFAMLSDPAFREQVAEAQEVVSVEVRLTPADDGFSLVNDQVQNTKDLPAIAKKITGDATRAVITEEWSSPDGGSITITAPGKPTSAAGTVTIAAGPAGTTEVVSCTSTDTTSCARATFSRNAGSDSIANTSSGSAS